ncbi:hypothetical protein KUTeg_012003 [Tegillarca granosa]|uniref:Uncharacterized protein n=1 Tax=Tegillarca granosa TaxID=220873 RepID=A0ABQ9F3J5_TEGGR|nr:hypothetical protein KUTeg_012003 [Tegillarca granosa]
MSQVFKEANVPIAFSTSTFFSRWICISPRLERRSWCIVVRKNVFTLLRTLNERSAVAVATGIVKSTVNIDQIHGYSPLFVTPKIFASNTSQVAWLGVTFSNFIYMGTVRSFGLFFVEYLEVFSGTLPVLTYGLRSLSVRQSVMVGAFLCSLSYFLNSFATSIEYVVVVQGLLFGTGAAWVYPPGLVLLGQYFDKRRGLANGVAMAGVSIGALVLPPAYSMILSYFGLFGGMMLTSGIMLNLFVVSAVYRPPSFYQKTVNDVLDIKVEESEDLKNNYNPLTKNSRLTSSQPLLQTENVGTALDHNARSQSVFDVTETDVQENTRSISIKLSQSSFMKYLGNSVMDLQQLDYGNRNTSSENTKTRNSFCDTNSKLCPFDASLLKHLPFMLNTVAFCFGCQAIGVGPVYIAPFAVENNIEVKNAALLLSVIGAADFVSRLLGGYLADLKCFKKQYMVAISQGILCIIMNMARFCEKFWTFVIFSIMTGFFGGIAIAVNPTVILDTTGADRHRSGVFSGITQDITVFSGISQDITI